MNKPNSQKNKGHQPKQHDHENAKRVMYAGLATMTMVGGMGATPLVLAQELTSEPTELVAKDAATNPVDNDTAKAETPVVATPEALPTNQLPAAPVANESVEAPTAVTTTADETMPATTATPTKKKGKLAPSTAETPVEVQKAAKAKDARAGYVLKASDFAVSSDGATITGFDPSFYNNADSVNNWDGTLTFPTDVKFSKVTTIGAKSFSVTYTDNSGLKAIYQRITSVDFTNLPATLMYVGSNSFNGNTGLKTATAANLPALIQFGDSTFEGCTNLTDVHISNVPSFRILGKNVFKDAKNLNKLYVSGMSADFNKSGSGYPNGGSTGLTAGGQVILGSDADIAVGKTVANGIGVTGWYIPVKVTYKYIDKNTNNSIGGATIVDDKLGATTKVAAPTITGYNTPVLTSDSTATPWATLTPTLTYAYTPTGAPRFDIYWTDTKGAVLKSQTISGNYLDTLDLVAQKTAIAGDDYQFRQLYSSTNATSATNGTWTPVAEPGEITYGPNNGTKYKYVYAQQSTVQYQYVDIHGNELDEPTTISGFADEALDVPQPEAIAGYDSHGIRINTANPNVWQPIDEITGTTLGDVAGKVYQYVYAKIGTVNQVCLDEAGHHINLPDFDNEVEHPKDDGDEYDFSAVPVIPGYGAGRVVTADDEIDGTPNLAAPTGEGNGGVQIVYYQYQTIAKPGHVYWTDSTTDENLVSPAEFGVGATANDTFTPSFIGDDLDITGLEPADVTAAVAADEYRYSKLLYTDDDPTDENVTWQLYDNELTNLPTTLGANNGRSYKFVYDAATTVTHKYVDQDNQEIMFGTDNVVPENFAETGFVGDNYVIHDAPTITGYDAPTLISDDLPNAMTANPLEIVYQYKTWAQPVTIYRVDGDGNDLGSETLTAYVDDDLDLTPVSIDGYEFQNLYGSALPQNASRLTIPDLGWEPVGSLATPIKHGENAGRSYKFVYAKQADTNENVNSGDNDGTGTDTDTGTGDSVPELITDTGVGGSTIINVTPTPVATSDKTPGDLPGTGSTGTTTQPTSNPTGGGTSINPAGVNAQVTPQTTENLPQSGSVENRVLPAIGAMLLAGMLGLYGLIKKRKS